MTSTETTGPAERPTTEDGYSPPRADGPLPDDVEALPASSAEPVLAIDLDFPRQQPAPPTPGEELGYSGTDLPGDSDRTYQTGDTMTAPTQPEPDNDPTPDEPENVPQPDAEPDEDDDNGYGDEERNG